MFIFGLRLHPQGDALAAIRLIGGHVGIVAVDHRPVVAELGLVAAGGQSEGQCDEAGKGQRGGGSGTGVRMDRLLNHQGPRSLCFLGCVCSKDNLPRFNRPLTADRQIRILRTKRGRQGNVMHPVRYPSLR